MFHHAPAGAFAPPYEEETGHDGAKALDPDRERDRGEEQEEEAEDPVSEEEPLLRWPPDAPSSEELVQLLRPRPPPPPPLP